MELANKVAIVTGGANGLGKAIVEMLLSNNTIVCVLDISKEALESLVKNKNLFKIPCDITKENQISNTIQEIKNNFLR